MHFLIATKKYQMNIDRIEPHSWSMLDYTQPAYLSLLKSFQQQDVVLPYLQVVTAGPPLEQVFTLNTDTTGVTDVRDPL